MHLLALVSRAEIVMKPDVRFRLHVSLVWIVEVQ